MTPQAETTAKQPKPPAEVPNRRLSVVYFTSSVVICGVEMDSASVPMPSNIIGGHRPGNSVDSIALAWLERDGSVIEDTKGVSGPSDGLVFRKRTHDNVRNVRVGAQTFVPWSRVRCVTYGPE